MTIKEYGEIEERFKNDTLGRQIDYDGMFPGECYDLAQVYFTQYLGVPEGVLGGCIYVNHMLYPPKLNQLLQYFDEVPTNNMIKGDVCIWDWGGDLCHIATFDICEDGHNCWFVTQNNPVYHLTTLSILENANCRAFRLKGVVPDPEPQPEPPTPPTPEPPTTYNVGDLVEINGVYVSSDSEEQLTPAVTEGTITYVLYGAKNPYLLNNGDIGWVNSECITSLIETSNDEKILDLVRRTIRGDFGNGEERKEALGDMYDEVQRQVELNYQNGTIDWDNIRLY